MQDYKGRDTWRFPSGISAAGTFERAAKVGRPRVLAPDWINHQIPMNCNRP